MYALEVNEWDLDRSIRWYHAHRNDSCATCNLSKEQKHCLYGNCIEERPGTCMSTLMLSRAFNM